MWSGKTIITYLQNTYRDDNVYTHIHSNSNKRDPKSLPQWNVFGKKRKLKNLQEYFFCNTTVRSKNRTVVSRILVQT